MSLYYLPGFLGTGAEFGVVQTLTVTTTDHGALTGLADDDHPQYPERTNAETVTGAWTFDRDPSAPFVVTAGSAKVANLDADLLDGKNESVFAEIAAAETITGPWILNMALDHDGTTVGFYAKAPASQAVASANLTDNSGGTANDTVQALTNPADAPANADALTDDLVLNLIPELRNNYADLVVKVNKALTVLRDVGLMAT